MSSSLELRIYLYWFGCVVVFIFVWSWLDSIYIAQSRLDCAVVGVALSKKWTKTELHELCVILNNNLLGTLSLSFCEQLFVSIQCYSMWDIFEFVWHLCVWTCRCGFTHFSIRFSRGVSSIWEINHLARCVILSHGGSSFGLKWVAIWLYSSLLWVCLYISHNATSFSRWILCWEETCKWSVLI